MRRTFVSSARIRAYPRTHRHRLESLSYLTSRSPLPVEPPCILRDITSPRPRSPPAMAIGGPGDEPRTAATPQKPVSSPTPAPAVDSEQAPVKTSPSKNTDDSEFVRSKPFVPPLRRRKTDTLLRPRRPLPTNRLAGLTTKWLKLPRLALRRRSATFLPPTLTAIPYRHAPNIMRSSSTTRSSRT